MECVKESSTRNTKLKKKLPSEPGEPHATTEEWSSSELNYPTIADEMAMLEVLDLSNLLLSDTSSNTNEQASLDVDKEYSKKKLQGIQTVESQIPVKFSVGNPTLELLVSQQNNTKDSTNVPKQNNSSEYSSLEHLDIKEDLQITELEISSKMLKVELELKKAQLKKEQLEKEKQLVDQVFKVRMDLLNNEIDLATKMRNLEERKPPPMNAVTLQSIGWNSNKYTHPSSPPLQPAILDNTVYGYKDNELHLGHRIPAAVPAIHNTTALGLRQLNVLDCVTIRKLRSQDLDETYEVVAPHEGLVMFRVNVTVAFICERRVLHLTLIDNEVNEVAIFQAGPDNYMDLFVCEQLAAKVKKIPTYFKPFLMVHDDFARPVLKVKGPSKNEDRNTFYVQTLNKNNIGTMDKRPAQATQHYESTHAIIQFPLDLDVRYKVALIAANFLIVDCKTCQTRERNLYASMTATSRMNTNHQPHQFMAYPTRLDFK